MSPNGEMVDHCQAPLNWLASSPSVSRTSSILWSFRVPHKLHDLRASSALVAANTAESTEGKFYHDQYHVHLWT